MSQGAGTVVVQLDSQTATKVTNEHYRLQLAEPIHIPYLSKPRCNLEALSFSNSFSNVDGVRLDNNKVRLAWKVHEPTDANKTYNSLPWHTLELDIDDSFQTTASIEAEIARQIEARSSDFKTVSCSARTVLAAQGAST
jgi:hypothetical protein